MRLAILLGCAALSGCKATAQTPRSVDPTTYVRVIDGDTIVFRGERVRLLNIDTPELPPKAKCWAEAALAVKAAEEMLGQVERASSIRIERNGKDRYGRTLARVYDGGQDIGERLVNMGVAARWTGRRWDWCGPPDFASHDGPWFGGGPHGNPEFLRWLSDQEGRVYDEALRDAARDAGFEVSAPAAPPPRN